MLAERRGSITRPASDLSALSAITSCQPCAMATTRDTGSVCVVFQIRRLAQMPHATIDVRGAGKSPLLPLRTRLCFGLVAAFVLWGGFVLLPLLVPGYDSIRQTVSEIGELDSPARVPFAVMLCMVSVCVLLFASGLRDASRRLGRSSAAAWLTGFMAMSSAGVGIFAYPHPLHGVFGLSEFVGYQAPWVFALTWRRETSAAGLVRFSWVMGVLMWVAITANLSVLDLHSRLWQFERPFYGIVQRMLFFTWCLWLAGVSLALTKNRNIVDDSPRTAASVAE
ncbi:DUF998 domain-containing protein [Dyella telluris]|uniref:DUF998 domain-containing protein n=1 Tax=Dyella telluris TaxID=2763498 RepID=A0A7G8Q5T7_9GAMM|nr:DUF998 domain-containing protein [Dyella telluris]QNK02145.1 DUF998 domain-containing protein [Dyella telluris]